MKIAVITGANSGIGLETAKALAKQNYELILLVRSQQKADETRFEISKVAPNAKLDFYFVDLSDFNSIQNATKTIKAKYQSIDRLINNAGYSPVGMSFTGEGYEKSFVANHLGPFVLTLNLMGLLKKSPESRIINVSSGIHTMGRVERFFKKNPELSDFAAYSDGKLANILFTKGLVDFTKGSSITSYSLHPGVIKSNFGSDMKGFLKILFQIAKPFMLSVEKGAETTIYLASTDIKNIQNENGSYFVKSKPASTRNPGITKENVKFLWDKSFEIVKSYLN